MGKHQTPSDSLLAFVIRMNRNSLTVKAVMSQWEVTREVTGSFCVKFNYQLRIIRMKQDSARHHLETETLP